MAGRVPSVSELIAFGFLHLSATAYRARTRSTALLSSTVKDHRFYQPVDSRAAPAMDKDNRDDFTFAKLSDLKMPVTFRMYATRSILASRAHWTYPPDPSLRERANHTHLPRFWKSPSCAFTACSSLREHTPSRSPTGSLNDLSEGTSRTST